MSNNDKEHQPSQRLLVLALTASFLAIVGTAAILYYLGMFRTVTVQQTIAPAYRIAYLPHTGPYNEIDETIAQVKKDLVEANINTTFPCALFLDDPSVVSSDRLRSKVGFLISGNGNVPNTVQVEQIAPREIVQASFDGSPVIGSYKAYSAMKQWSKDHGYSLSLPALEIYHEKGVVEYQLPIRKNLE